jgi:hypothetical protein
MPEQIGIGSVSVPVAKCLSPPLSRSLFHSTSVAVAITKTRHETEDPNDVVGHDGDDEPSDKEVDYESDYSYLDSDNSRNSSDRQRVQGKSRTDCGCCLSM